MAPCHGEAQSSAARCRGLPRASAATRIKSGSDGPKAREATHHDRLEKRAKENLPLILVGVSPRADLKDPRQCRAVPLEDLRHRRSVPLVVGTTSDGAALTWRQSQPNHPLTGAGSRLVLCKTPKRKARRVPPTFKVQFRNLDHRLPAWQIKGKVVGASFNWKLDRQHYFGAWEQEKYVRWTRTPRPSRADLRWFLTETHFFSI